MLSREHEDERGSRTGVMAKIDMGVQVCTLTQTRRRFLAPEERDPRQRRAKRSPPALCSGAKANPSIDPALFNQEQKAAFGPFPPPPHPQPPRHTAPRLGRWGGGLKWWRYGRL